MIWLAVLAGIAVVFWLGNLMGEIVTALTVITILLKFL